MCLKCIIGPSGLGGYVAGSNGRTEERDFAQAGVNPWKRPYRQRRESKNLFNE